MLDEYVLGRVIGRGGFATVYEAVRRDGGERVALKCVEVARMDELGLLARVRGEVTLHAALDHERVVRLYDSFEEDGLIVLVLELCGGGELYRRVRREGALGERETARVVRQLVQGLCYLHERGVVHRDLKLSNILLDDEGNVKIADFGMAVRVEAGGEQYTMCGTPNYISPEILARGAHGPATDVWTLGCVLYTCLVGRAPFECEQVADTLKRVAAVDYALPATLSHEAVDLLQLLLRPQPGERASLEAVLRHAFLRPAARLTTRGVAAGVHRTRHGEVRILDDGRVETFKFGDDERLVIAADGAVMAVVDADGVAGASVGVDDASEHLMRRYRHASRVLDLVRSRAPVAVFETSLAVSRLLDSPSKAHPDVEVDFHSGFRVRYPSSRRCLEIVTPAGDAYELTDASPDAASEVDLALLKHTQFCLSHLTANGC